MVNKLLIHYNPHKLYKYVKDLSFVCVQVITYNISHIRIDNDKKVNGQIADAIETLWKEDAIRLIYDLRATMKIDDSCAYFWDEVKRIAAPDYVPNDKDILLVRYRTTGMI